MLILDAFADRYGWTWEQIMDAPQRVLDVLPQIWDARNDVIERRQAAEAAKVRAKGGIVGAGMSSAGIKVEGAAKTEDTFTLLARKADAATKACVRDSVTIYHREIANNLRKKSHPKGTQTPSAPGEPPALVSGSLMRSIKDQAIKRLGRGVYEGGTGPTIVYARIQELGGWTGRGHRTFLPRRPYVRPAVRSAHPKVDARFRKLLHDVTTLGG